MQLYILIYQVPNDGCELNTISRYKNVQNEKEKILIFKTVLFNVLCNRK